ncbi:hypothetical protein Bca4012_027969 [Brassica carinata]
MDSVALYCTAARLFLTLFLLSLSLPKKNGLCGAILHCTVARCRRHLIYWLICPAEKKGKRASDLSGGSISAENIKDNYNQYWSFFRKPKEIESADQVPDFVDTFYNLVTDIYDWVWGQSFHFSPSIPGKSDKEATRIHEEMAVDLIEVKLG